MPFITENFIDLSERKSVEVAKKRTIDEWIELYEKKTKLKYETPDPRTRRFYFPDRGFAEIGIASDMVVIVQTSGEGLFWKQVAEILAAERGITHLGCWVVRDIEPYIKLFGIEVEKTEEKEKGFKRYYDKFKDNGKKVLLTPQGKISNGNIRYIATWEI